MEFWFLEKRGHGKFKHFIPKQVSEKKARELDSDGVQVFNTRKEAQRKANELRNS